MYWDMVRVGSVVERPVRQDDPVFSAETRDPVGFAQISRIDPRAKRRVLKIRMTVALRANGQPAILGHIQASFHYGI